MYRVIFDTTYILPSFGIELEEISRRDIKTLIEKLMKKGINLYLSRISLLEAYLKTISIARKKKIKELFPKAIEGIKIITNDENIIVLDYLEEDILEEANRIMQRHYDPFDAIIFATAITKDLYLLTEDKEASRFIKRKKLFSLNEFISIL